MSDDGYGGDFGGGDYAEKWALSLCFTLVPFLYLVKLPLYIRSILWLIDCWC